MENGSLGAVLGGLDPVSRALLDLSLRRGLRPDEIAGVLGMDEDTVVDARERALVLVADQLGIDGDDRLDQVRARLAELPADEWSGVAPAVSADDESFDEDPGEELDAMATAGPDPALLEEAEHELEAEDSDKPAKEPPSRRRSRTPVALLKLLRRVSRRRRPRAPR